LGAPSSAEAEAAFGTGAAAFGTGAAAIGRGAAAIGRGAAAFGRGAAEEIEAMAEAKASAPYAARRLSRTLDSGDRLWMLDMLFACRGEMAEGGFTVQFYLEIEIRIKKREPASAASALFFSKSIPKKN
jgi:hypothetical protein